MSDHWSGRMSQDRRFRLYLSRQWRCQHCRRKGDGDGSRGVRLTIDHIVPKSKGGPLAPWNLAVLCSDCNEEKGDAVWPHLFALPVPPEWQMFVRVAGVVPAREGS